MTRGNAWMVGALLASLAAPPVLAVDVQADGTSIAKTTDAGGIIFLTTGTDGGECTVDQNRIACYDGASFATADLALGCGKSGGGGYCLVAGDGGLNVSAAGSTTDITCGSGSKNGRIYTMTDGDGSGTCGPDRGVDGRINGATCTKSGTECASMNCNEGCQGVGMGCECHERSTRPAPMVTNPLE